ncbi:MAG: glycine zipper 2TM domain-containing protein [Gammaproteobacteria bacterium]|nr:glycine zipper 2TM domain-containing protein [Gammaproteobacteria bacterium]MDE0273114.1 glycine zipper 2TM domain-containing protein [Gammaproteobacteria bacterium]
MNEKRMRAVGVAALLWGALGVAAPAAMAQHNSFSHYREVPSHRGDIVEYGYWERRRPHHRQHRTRQWQGGHHNPRWLGSYPHGYVEDSYPYQYRSEGGGAYRSSTPTLLGAIVGGALGNELGHKKRNKQIGAVVGALLGGSIGRDLAEQRRRDIDRRY